MFQINANNIILAVSLFAMTVFYGCATLSGAGSVQYENSMDEVREAVEEALQEMGMEVGDVREDFTSNLIIIGEMEQMGAQTEEGEVGAVDIVRLEVEINELDDGTVSVSAATPTAANYASTTGEDLNSQFFSSMEDQNLNQIESD